MMRKQYIHVVVTQFNRYNSPAMSAPEKPPVYSSLARFTTPVIFIADRGINTFLASSLTCLLGLDNEVVVSLGTC